MIGSLLVSLVLLSPGTPPPAKSAGIPFERDFEAALRKAKASGKPVMIDFWAQWCGWCHRLDETTYKDPQVVKLARGFVPVKVNTEGSRSDVSVALRYRISSLPTVVFVSPSGRVVMRLEGFQGPGQFPRVLEAAKEMAGKLIAFESALDKDPGDARALSGIGVHLLDSDLWEEARDMFTRARQQDADVSAAERKQTRLLLGTIEYYASRYPQAEQILKEGLSLRPEGEYEPKLLYVLGKTYLKWGRKQEGRAALQSLLEGYAQSPIAQKARETLVALDGQR